MTHVGCNIKNKDIFSKEVLCGLIHISIINIFKPVDANMSMEIKSKEN
jgi:hypothetical protein